jgi:uncharacterized protein YcbK (DUF882 family)
MTDKQWEKYKPEFSSSEFNSPDIPNSGRDKMKKDFIDKLFKARKKSNVPYKISSGYRSPAYNAEVGGTSGSSHMKGCACDIKFRSNKQRFKIIQGLIEAGFVRLGLGHNFIHVDNDKDKAQQTAWDYIK